MIQKIFAAAAGKNIADILFVDDSWMPGFLKEDMLEPVADAKAKIEQEKREAEAETIEANILTALAKNMQRETGLPIQDCVTAIQRERGKIEAKEFLLGGNALTSVAAALGTWLTQKGGK